MGVQRLLAIIPLVAPLVQAQSNILNALKQNGGASTTSTNEPAVVAPASDATTPGDSTINAISEAMDQVVATTNEPITSTTAEIDELVTAPDYDEEQCDSWISVLAASDDDASGGLSGAEYYTFLSDITNPPYVGKYFQTFTGYSDLPWTFRVIHKTLACHCEQLDMGPKCCEADKAEVLILGLGNANVAVPALRDTTTQTEYRDMFCQHIAYALTRSVPTPAPTNSPTPEPTESPTVSPTKAPTSSPTKVPTAAPVDPTAAPTVKPTVEVIAVEEPPEVITFSAPPEEEDDGLSTGSIIGIIAAILIALLAIVAMVAYRRKLERDRLRKFAGDQAPEADLEAPPPAADGPGLDPKPEPATEPSPGDQPEEDDESSAPSVWSASEDEDTNAEMHDANQEDDRVTAGSALAAMGAASTVAANLMNQNGNTSDGSGNGGVV